MTRPELSPESAQILTDKTEDLTTKFGDSIDKVVDILARRYKAFDIMHTREGLSADPERLAAISAGLFDKVDTLIFLAEDYRGLADRIRASQPAISVTESVQDGYYSKEELELFDIFQQSDDSAVAAVWILGKGFGLSVSENYTTRKKLLQKTITSLHNKLSRTEPPMEIIKTGQTRGTKYQLAELALDSLRTPVAAEIAPAVEVVNIAEVTEVTAVAAGEPQIEAAAPVKAFAVPVASTEPLQYVARQESLVSEETEKALAGAIGRLIESDARRPILCVGDITREAFGPKQMEERKYQLVKQLIEQDPRVTESDKNEYQIVGREDMTDWVDKEDLEERVHAFIDDMARRNVSDESYRGLVRNIGRGRRFLTSLERAEMMNIVRAHPQYVSFSGSKVVFDLTRPGLSTSPTLQTMPHEHAGRGLSRSEINTRLSELGMSGRVQPGRRYDLATKRRSH